MSPFISLTTPQVGSESPCELLDDTLLSWCGRLEGVIGQEVARARELTTWAKEALQHADGGEGGRQQTSTNTTL